MVVSSHAEIHGGTVQHGNEQPTKFLSVSFDAMKIDSVAQRPTTIGEIDASVSGNAESFHHLCELSDVKFIPETVQPPTNHQTHILAVEAKLTSSTLIRALGGRDDSTKIWWLMQPRFHENTYRAIILNG